MSDQPLISVIVANFNGEKYIETCIKSVLKSNYPSFELIIIDDGSTDTSREVIQKHAQDTRLVFIKNEKNMGLSRSRNNGLAVAKGEIFIALDNDTEVEPEWMKGFIEVLNDPAVGAAQSKLIEFDKRDEVQLIGTKLIPYTGWSVPLERNIPLNQSEKNPIEIIALGAAFAWKKEVFDKVGLFDPQMVYFNEDLDYSWRVWIAGYRIVLAPNSHVYHWTKPPSQRKNTGSTLERIYYNMCRNSTRSMLKNYELLSVIKYFPINICILIVRAVLVLVRRGDTSSFAGTMKALWWNIVSFSDTLAERKKVQNTRAQTDEKLFIHIMVPGSPLDIYNKYFKHTGLM